MIVVAAFQRTRVSVTKRQINRAVNINHIHQTDIKKLFLHRLLDLTLGGHLTIFFYEVAVNKISYIIIFFSINFKINKHFFCF